MLESKQYWEDQSKALASELKETKREFMNLRQYSADIDYQLDLVKKDSVKQQHNKSQYLETINRKDHIIRNYQSSLDSMNQLYLSCLLEKEEVKTTSVIPVLSLSNSLQSLAKELGQLKKYEVACQQKEDELFVSLADNFLFESGSYKVSQSGGRLLRIIAGLLKNHQDVKIMVIGHTDSEPIRRRPIRDNWDLSVMRASSIVRILKRDFKIAPERMIACGKASFDAIADNSTAAGRQKNRRTELILSMNKQNP